MLMYVCVRVCALVSEIVLIYVCESVRVGEWVHGSIGMGVACG